MQSKIAAYGICAVLMLKCCSCIESEPFLGSWLLERLLCVPWLACQVPFTWHHSSASLLAKGSLDSTELTASGGLLLLTMHPLRTAAVTKMSECSRCPPVSYAKLANCWLAKIAAYPCNILNVMLQHAAWSNAGVSHTKFWRLC